MEILSVVALRGPNVWAKVPVLEARIDVGCWQGLAPEMGAEFYARLRGLMAGDASGLAAAQTAGETPALQEGLPLAGALAAALRDAAIEFQTRAGTPVAFGTIRGTDDHGVYRVAVEYEEERLGRACLDAARDLCRAAAQGRSYDLTSELQRLRALAVEVDLGTTTGALVRAARARGIPFRRLDDLSLTQLGHGARQRRVMTAMTDRTGKLAEWVSLDKQLTKALLRELGIPVPAGRQVTSPDDAWAAACELGLPVAVKPQSADYGHGVGLNLVTREQVAAAYAAARQYREEVLVERFAPGEQYRVTVVGEQMVAAVRRDSARVLGDGQSTISQLIAEANRDPRRGNGESYPLDYIAPDEDTPAVLADQEFTLDSVPPEGTEVRLSRLCHTWAGAGVTDVTDHVHPQAAAQCVAAVRVVGLDLAGLDVITANISRPLEEQGGVILEVNAGPAIALHFTPFCDRYRPVCEAVIDSLFPPGATGRIPLVVVAGQDDNTTTSRWIAHLLEGAGQRIGRASSDGLWLDGQRLNAGNQASLAGTRAALLSPQVELAVLERSLEGIRHEGLGVDRVEAAVITGLGRGERRDPRGNVHHDRIEAARVLVEAVVPNGFAIIDADDPLAVALAASCRGSVIWLAAHGDQLPTAAAHDRPCRMVCRDGDTLLLIETNGSPDNPSITRLPAPLDVESGDASRSLLAAVAVAWAFDVPPDVIRARLAPRDEPAPLLQTHA